MILPFEENTNKKISTILSNPFRVYLLYGEQYIGKYLASRHIASMLLDDKKIIKDDYLHPALHIVNNQADNKAIGISDIKHLTESIWHTTHSDTKQKVIIISKIDNITESAANALLKNLEDIPSETTIILTADNLEAVLPTIISRSQLVYCRPSRQRATDHLMEYHGLDSSKAEEYMLIANDRLRKAIENLDEQSYEQSKLIQSLATQFLDGSISTRFIIAKQIHEKSLGQTFLSELIYATNKQSTILYDRLDFVEHIMQAINQLRINVNARIVIENLALR